MQYITIIIIQLFSKFSNSVFHRGVLLSGIRVKDSKLYLFLFSCLFLFYFPFIFLFLDLGLEVSMILHMTITNYYMSQMNIEDSSNSGQAEKKLC